MLVLSGEVISEDLTAQKWPLDPSPSLGEHQGALALQQPWGK